jgi:hypothetical protein
MRVYRTVTGATQGAEFYFVADIGFDGTGQFVDTVSDLVVVNNNTLASTSFLPPPPDLDGLTVLPGGMLVGFTTNTIHFCEPNRPHAWPAGYDQSLQYEIVGFGVWQAALIVLTKGYPSTGQGSAPSNFTFSQVQVPEPCISRGSIITDLMGVYYASQNGLVMLNYFGMQNQTLSTLTKNIWLTEYKAQTLVACRHRAQYLAINGTGTGFIIDYTEPRLGIVHLSPFAEVVSVWNDSYTGATYMCADNKVFVWDSPNSPPLTYRWRSKQFFFPEAYNFGAAQVELGHEVLTPPPSSNTPLLDNADPALILPTGVNCLFRVLAERNGVMTVMFEAPLREPRNLIRLPSGFREWCWQVEVVSRVPVFSIQVARTNRELSEV